jgi:hypothetical protein
MSRSVVVVAAGRASVRESPVILMPGGLNVSTYAFSPGINQYLYFYTNAANNGATSSNW